MIPRFNWLRDQDRRRGEAFLDGSANSAYYSWQENQAKAMIECSLVDPRVPVRFVHCDGDLSIDQLRQTIQQLFSSDAPITAGSTAMNMAVVRRAEHLFAAA